MRSGEDVEEYAQELEALGRDWRELVLFESTQWERIGGPAAPISLSVSRAIDEHASPGISPHLVICSVRRGAVEFGTNDVVALSPGAQSRTMPPIARTWSEWQTFKQDHGLADQLALA